MFKDTPLGAASKFTFANGADKPATSMVVAEPAEIFYDGCAPEVRCQITPLCMLEQQGDGNLK